MHRLVSDLVVLGAACPMLPGRNWSSFVVGGKVLLEAPPMLTQCLHQCSIDPLDISVIVISHLHGDHFAGLPFLLLEYDVVTSRRSKLVVLGPKGIEQRTKALMQLYYPGWDREVHRHYLCEFREVTDGQILRLDGFVVQAVEVDHGLGPGQAMGFRIEWPNGVIGFSGDTKYTDAIYTLASDADLLILDCTHAEYVAGSNHLSLPEVVGLRENISQETQFVLTHQGEPFPDSLPDGVYAPEDGERLSCQSRSQGQAND